MSRRIQYDTSDEIVRAVINNNLRKKSDLNFFERGLMNRDIIPKSYFDKRARPEAVLEAQAELWNDGIIQPLGEGENVLWFWFGSKLESREGRSPHPKHYHPANNRNQLGCTVLRRDRNLLWYIGKGSVPVGFQNVCQFVRENQRLFQEQYPCDIGPEGL